MSNRFKKNADKVAKDITSNNKDNAEEKRNRDIELKSYGDNTFYDYRKIPIKGAKNGDKYKTNFSFEEDTLQKLQHMLTYGNFTSKDNSKVPAKALDLLYYINFKLKEKGIDVFELSEEEIVENFKNIEI